MQVCVGTFLLCDGGRAAAGYAFYFVDVIVADQELQRAVALEDFLDFALEQVWLSCLLHQQFTIVFSP